MKFDIKIVVLWFLVFYFFIEGAFRDLILLGRIEAFNLFDSIFTPSSMMSFFLFTFCAYVILYIWHPRRNWYMITILTICAMLLPIAFRFLLEQKLFYFIFDTTNYPLDYSTIAYIQDNFRYGFRYVIFGMLLYFYQFSQYKQKQAVDLVTENQQIQLNMLRSQINPHFLLNSLNNIYSLVYHNSAKSLEALDYLTQLLKYSLYSKKEYVTVKEEMDQIHAFIELQSLRTSAINTPDIDIKKETKSCLIPQLTILPIVENAYKHGIFDKDQPPFSLSIILEDGFIIITCRNTKSTYEKDHVGGVGLDNLQRRLQLLFPNNHAVNLENHEAEFLIRLKIPQK